MLVFHKMAFNLFELIIVLSPGSNYLIISLLLPNTNTNT